MEFAAGGQRGGDSRLVGKQQPHHETARRPHGQANGVAGRVYVLAAGAWMRYGIHFVQPLRALSTRLRRRAGGRARRPRIPRATAPNSAGWPRASGASRDCGGPHFPPRAARSARRGLFPRRPSCGKIPRKRRSSTGRLLHRPVEIPRACEGVWLWGSVPILGMPDDRTYRSELTVRTCRPFARRAASTRLPPGVFILARKPCVFARRRRFG